MSLKICRIGRESFDKVNPEPRNWIKNGASKKRLSSHLDGSVVGSALKSLQQRQGKEENFKAATKTNKFAYRNRSTQTDYREVECQTEPWEPPYRVAEGHEPEALLLRSFTWGDGLPVGMHEIEVINRMRMRRAWERVLPPMDTPCNIKKRSAIVAALEADEWAFREAEIQAMMDLRLELTEKLMKERDNERRRKFDGRYRKLDETLDTRRKKEAKNIRNKLTRELRKLKNRHRRLACRIGIDDENDRRDGGKRKSVEACRRRVSRSIYERGLFDDDDDDDEEDPNTTGDAKQPKWTCKMLTSGKKTRLCRRFVERRNRRLSRYISRASENRASYDASEQCALLRRKERLPSLPSTPLLSWRSSEKSDGQRQIDATVEYLRVLVDGRAVQSKFVVAKNRCAELIEELQAAQVSEKEETAEELAEKLKRKQEEEKRVARENRIKEMLQALEGQTIAKTLMFLNDELTRLENERKEHALVLLAERARMTKKLEEASRERLEENQRRELDEIQAKIMRVNRTILEDVVKEGLECDNEREADEYVNELAVELEAMADYMDENIHKIDEEGIVADVVYNFVLPRVARLSDRCERKSAAREIRESRLRAARESICDNTRVLGIDGENEADYDASSELSEKEVSSKEQRRDLLPKVIELILDYSLVSNESCKRQIYIILEEMLGVAKEKLMISN